MYGNAKEREHPVLRKFPNGKPIAIKTNLVES